MPWDSFDRKILNRLSKNCKEPLAEISRAVGLSPSACFKRIKKLEESGVIQKYAAILSSGALGYRLSVFIEVSLRNQKKEALEAFEKEVALHPEILECYLMSGRADYLLRARCRDAADYEKLHANTLTLLPNVERLSSHFVIRETQCWKNLPPERAAALRDDALPA